MSTPQQEHRASAFHPSPEAAFRLSYGEDMLQFGELSLPQRSGPHSVVILIHGGFWRNAYDRSLMHGLAEDLTAEGIAVWNIEYRRIGDTGGGWPGTLQDVALAADFLQQIAPHYALDLQRIVAVGHSAGGHLALWLAARHKLPVDHQFSQSLSPLSLKGVISLAGVSDLEEAWHLHLGNDAVNALLGGSPQEVPERYAVASPANLLPLNLPQILIHGTQDDRVPLLLSQHYQERARQGGESISLIELPDTDHFVLIHPTTQAWQKSKEALKSLLFSH